MVDDEFAAVCFAWCFYNNGGSYDDGMLTLFLSCLLPRSVPDSSRKDPGKRMRRKMPTFWV